jgi:hypothetical protein
MEAASFFVFSILLKKQQLELTKKIQRTARPKVARRNDEAICRGTPK